LLARSRGFTVLRGAESIKKAHRKPDCTATSCPTNALAVDSDVQARFVLQYHLIGAKFYFLPLESIKANALVGYCPCQRAHLPNRKSLSGR